MIKKASIGTLSIAMMAMVYYFTMGSTQLIAQMQMQVNTQVATLKNEGFAIEENNISETARHYELTLDNPKKVSAFLLAQGIELSVEDIREFQGLKVGIDVHYLGTMASAVAFDIYPLAFPTLYTLAMQQSQDKALFSQIEKMLEKKTFLIHLEFNKLLNHFTGYFKDIDEGIKADKVVNLHLKGMKFEGDIQDKRLNNLRQTLESMYLKAENSFDMNLTKLENTYTRTGKGEENYRTEYKLENLAISSDDKTFSMHNMHIDSYAKLANILSGFGIKTKIKEIAYSDKKQKTELQEIDLDIKADNFDMATLRKLENINPNDDKAVMHTLQKLISHGITLSLANFSIKSLNLNAQKLDGFTLSSHFEIDKSLNIMALNTNPMSAINAMNANIYLSLSRDIFATLAGHPQAMMTMMLFQPKDVNGSKVYDVKLKDGKLTLNGSPLL